MEVTRVWREKSNIAIVTRFSSFSFFFFFFFFLFLRILFLGTIRVRVTILTNSVLRVGLASSTSVEGVQHR
jgi:hypothetical protein